jgi:general secretion pathway protein D
VKSVIVTGDQRTVVIGGLMQDKKSESESKVPFFGDIPIIGWLFKNWSDTSKKTNLILLLTPYIVRSDEDFRKVYDLKMKERQAFIDSYFTDARRYDPYIDYDRKAGPMAKLLQAMDYEMKRVENGGPGVEGEELIGPAAFGERRMGSDTADGSDGERGAERNVVEGAESAPSPVDQSPPEPAPSPEPTPAPPQ